jgi:hypothetical protein
MRMDDGELWAFWLGALIAMLVIFAIAHIAERECQSDNNVADCDLVVVPAKQEE